MDILLSFMIGVTVLLIHFGIWVVVCDFKKMSLKQRIFEHSVLILIYITTINIGKLLMEVLIMFRNFYISSSPLYMGRYIPSK